MHVRMLSALVAKRARQISAAIQAFGFVSQAVGADFTSVRLNRTADDPAGHCIAQAFEIPHRHPHCNIRRAWVLMLAVRHAHWASRRFV